MPDVLLWIESAQVQEKRLEIDMRSSPDCQLLKKKLLQKNHLHSKLQFQSEAKQMLLGEVVLSQ